MRAGAEGRVAQLMGELADQVRAEDGNVLFQPHTLESDHRHYFVYEVYRDEAAFQAHLSMPHGTRFNHELAGLIEGAASQLTFLGPVPG